MYEPPLTPERERERLAALRRTRLLDTPPEEGFDVFTRVAAALCGTPIALISLVDETRQWFKSRVGLDATETAREVSFCGHAILDDAPLVVPDTLEDERFAANPLVSGKPWIRFYAGVPLLATGNHRLGTLCVIDRRPRDIEPATLDLLRQLARQVMVQVEFRELSLRLAEANEEMRALQQQKDEFVAMLSHDIRNPISAVSLIAQSLLARGSTYDDAKRERRLRQIMTAAQQANTLANNFLAAERLGATEVALEAVETRLGTLAEDLLSRAEAQAAERNVTLRVDVAEDAPAVRIDVTLLERAIANLLDNAIRHSPEGEEVVLAVEPRGSFMRVSVIDRGTGVPPERRDELFQKFSRGVSPGDEGTGLGLYVVRRIAEAHAGRVGTEFPAARGSVFWIELPNTRDERERSAALS